MMSRTVMIINHHVFNLVSGKQYYMHFRNGGDEMKIDMICKDILRYGSHTCKANYLLQQYRYNSSLLMTVHENSTSCADQMKRARKCTRAKLFIW